MVKAIPIHIAGRPGIFGAFAYGNYIFNTKPVTVIQKVKD
jgi:hypothetical protein